ncbi:carbamoyltransferase HypF [candidate division CSSED10-310 bacterium]|uniref:Carbamoyltransferase n=1 Tax=candidate division CSSED10-310 bacterium TaxID=2855610 RepID=A0ABV6YWI8_UNCC1
MKQAKVAHKIAITGMVQGVGFRPFIYRLAREESVRGRIKNSLSGVSIHLEGEVEAVTRMLARITTEKPVMANIASIQVTDTRYTGCGTFEIVPSKSEGEVKLSIAPDIGLCEACQSEMEDPADRRAVYPFINCVDCGPRYSIIRQLPYDRPLTSMSEFKMCPDCEREYHDPGDRRFHAQPVACPRCGPRMQLIISQSELTITDQDRVVPHTAQLLQAGKIVAIKGLGGYHLACDARSDEAVARLRERKGRPDKPFAIMAKDFTEIEQIAVVSEIEKRLLYSPRSPIILLQKQEVSTLSRHVSPRNRCIGVMIPYTPLHKLLFTLAPPILVMTSGNRSGFPICFQDEVTLQDLALIADAFLIHNRPIVNPCDDSVALEQSGGIYLQRCGRGEAPHEFQLTAPVPPVLACGAEQKAAVALTAGSRFILGPYLGDLYSAEALDHYTYVTRNLLDLYRVIPTVVVHDLHPDYLSSHFARNFPAETKTAVQHHHAHLAACLLENRCDRSALGFCFDGTGYGDDHTVWGGELLLGDLKSYQRVGHCSPLLMPGGEQAIKEPWRMALSYLYFHDKEQTSKLAEIFLPGIAAKDTDANLQLLRNDVGPRTSSMGRIFDIAAALLQKRYRISYEGQGAMELQYLAENSSEQGSPFPLIIEERAEMMLVRPQTFIQPLLEGLQNEVKPESLALSFHLTVAQWVLQASVLFREKYGITTIVLTGGVFQNLLLLKKSRHLLEREKFTVLVHRRIPCNDGGIAFGQLAVALSRMGTNLIQE